MGVFKKIVNNDLALGILTGGVGLATKGIFRTLKGKKPAPVQDPAIALEAEQEEKRKKQQRAIEGLNPTGTLGAGTAQTTRSKVLGV